MQSLAKDSSHQEKEIEVVDEQKIEPIEMEIEEQPVVVESLSKKKSRDSISLVMTTIIVAQVVLLIYLLYPSTNSNTTIPDLPAVGSLDLTPQKVGHVMLIMDSEIYQFDDVTVRKEENGYWFYGDEDETVFVPTNQSRCIYLENPKEETIQQFLKGEGHVQSRRDVGDRGQEGNTRLEQPEIQRNNVD